VYITFLFALFLVQKVNLQKTVRLLANTDPIANEAVQRRLLLPPSYNHNSSGLAVNLSDSKLQAYLTDGNYITISMRWQHPQQHQH